MNVRIDSQVNLSADDIQLSTRYCVASSISINKRKVVSHQNRFANPFTL